VVQYFLECLLKILSEGVKFWAQHQQFTKSLHSLYPYSKFVLLVLNVYLFLFENCSRNGQFDIIPSILFLCSLQKSPIIPRNGQPGLEVSQEDADLFKILRKKHQDFTKVVKTFNSRKKSMQNDEEMNDKGE
jgi:hypothetical protein